jgi:hypothetical protein
MRQGERRKPAVRLSVDEMRNRVLQLELSYKAKAIVEEHGMDAFYWPQYEMRLRVFFGDWPLTLSKEVFLKRLDYFIESLELEIQGKEFYDPWERIEADIAAEEKQKRAEEQQKIIEDYAETITEHIEEVPPVETMEARIEKSEDGKTVLFFFNPTQDQRAVIALHGLDEKIYDEEPTHTKAELDTLQAEYDAELEEMQDSDYDDEDIRERRREIAEEMRELRAERARYTIIDYLTYPFKKDCGSRLEATKYADKLQKVVEAIYRDIKQYEKIDNTRIFRGDERRDAAAHSARPVRHH